MLIVIGCIDAVVEGAYGSGASRSDRAPSAPDGEGFFVGYAAVAGSAHAASVCPQAGNAISSPCHRLMAP